MRLQDAVAAYVDRRRAEGSPFVSSETTLRSFCKRCGDIDLRDVTENCFSRFLDSPNCSPITRLSKFSAVKCFLDYFSVRGEMPTLILQRPPKPVGRRSPFIYTHAQVRALLRASFSCQARAEHMSNDTLRMVLLLLYATGMTVNEAITLRKCDVDLRRMQLHIGAGRSKPKRIIPIGKGLRSELARHLKKLKLKTDTTMVLCSVSGAPVNRKNLCERFQRLHTMVGLRRNLDGGGPRLQDFRYTFAVHRVRSWLLAGANLNEVMPSLSAYMGYASLTKSEEFLAYVPERFHDGLQKLSPQKGRHRWADDPNLIKFLLSL